jgi:hypothetical protein
MKRTSVWLALLGIALLAAIWFVNGPLQSSLSPDNPTASSRPSPTPLPSVPEAGVATETTALTPNAITALPPSSIAELLTLPHDFSQTHAAYALAAAAADGAAVEDLIAEAQTVTRRSDRFALTTIFFSRYSEIDHNAALGFLAESDLESKLDLLYRIFDDWSKVDLDAAIGAAARLQTTAEQQAAVAAILRAHSDDGAGAVAMLMSRLLAAGISGNPQLSAAIRSASGEPEAALAAALALPRDEAEMLVANIGMGWAIQDPEAAFAYSRTMEDDTLRRRMLSGVFYAWVDRDPEGVMGMLDGQMTNDERSALINSGLARLAQRDPARALELSRRVGNSAYRQSALQRTFRTWADTDPAAAAAATATLQDIGSDNLGVLVREVGPAYARLAPVAALEWAKSVNDGQQYREVIAAVARKDPSLALDAAMALPTESERNSTIAQIAQTIAIEDVAAATDFWQRLPAENRPLATQGIVSNWAQTDPDAAASWVKGLPPGPEQQEALRTLLIMLARSEQATNYGQLLGLLDASERDSYAHGRINWLVRNGHREQAESELRQLSLSPEGYRRAREVIEQGSPGP